MRGIQTSSRNAVFLEISQNPIQNVLLFVLFRLVNKPGQPQCTYRAQSTAMISVMSSVGRPTDVSTITIVTRPACGIPAAPMLAAVAVILEKEQKQTM